MAHHAQTKTLAILDYWHKIEFFIPYGLDQFLDDLEEWQFKTLPANSLANPDNSGWMRIEVDAEKEIIGYNLFLGIFDKSAISQVCKNVAAQSAAYSGPCGVFEDEERTELDGLTCFAKLPLDKAGHPILDSISVSTAPWALGQTQNHGLQSLSYDAFDNARQNLTDQLRDFMSQRGLFAGRGLDATEVLTLQSLLCQWAGFNPPSEQPIAVLTAKVRPSESAKPTEKTAPKNSAANVEDDEEEVLEELDILNSFYIRDIERAIQSARKGNIPLTLQQYLIPLNIEERVDLYSDEGCRALMHALRPRFLNMGHWLSAPDQSMSLMQQFALNQIREDTKEGGLFAVNGPPGTGKTTLLRDLFADNIVQRTRILAGLAKADDAFDKQVTSVRFKADSGSVKLRPLIEALTGFEMVVTSTNNAAVENISLDLVKRKALNKPWQSATYLQPVAHNIAVQLSKRGATSPVGDQMPWGLISCALGNSRNRSNFNQRFGISSLETESNEKPQRIWDWLKQPNALSFLQARDAFRKIDNAVHAALKERERLAELLDLFGQETDVDYLAAPIARLEQANGNTRTIVESQASNLSSQASTQQSLVQLGEEQILIDRTAPGWWARLLRTRDARAYVKDRKANAQCQLQLRKHLKDLLLAAVSLEKKLLLAAEQTQTCEQQLKERQAQWQEWIDERDCLQIRLGTPRLPVNPLELMSDEQFQIEGLWHDEAMDLLRSELFAAALTLQQAWIHEAAQKGGALSSNLVAISKLLSNKTPEDPSHSLPIWQNLFMVVPVVSSTFASFANQFRGIGANSLGWVFIDEAGQAVPQAAVGALWRARRCVVVGDPLQIEPVFTLPTPLINALGGLNPVTADNAYAPHVVSVQRLADQANRFGAYAPFMDEMLWVGSPLRVHRRCHDPMFTLANRIAYDDKMVYGLKDRSPSATPLIDLPSGWVDIRGAVERKQAVPEQIEFMIKVIVQLYQRDVALPDIYVISPFKAIRLSLRERMLAHDWTHPAPRREDLKRWAKRSIGTVHTFQGKEEKTVFMVLGADSDNDGGAQWASSKPNLLNVALTRAQHRIYLVGDVELWGALPYFEKAASGETAMPCWKRQDFSVITRRSALDLAHSVNT